MALIAWILVLLALSASAEIIPWKVFQIDKPSNIEDTKRLIMINGAIDNSFSIRVICPNPFVIHPRNNGKEGLKDPLVFAAAAGSLVEVCISNVIPSLYGRPIVRFFKDDKKNGMEIHYPGVASINHITTLDIIRRNATHIYLICALPGEHIDDYMKDILHYLKTDRDTYFIRSMREIAFTYLKERNKAMGMVSIDISSIKNVTHGCGSMDTPQFMNEAHVDKYTNVRSCTVDIMKAPAVGFYCEGKVEPKRCFTTLIDSGTEEEINLLGHLIAKQSSDRKWYFAKYDRKSIRESFHGYCKCVDPYTGETKAKITVMTGMSHECDISALMFKHLTKPIIGNWCDVGLLPGSTLTIKVPINIYDETDPEIGYGKLIHSEPVMMNSYIYPQDMNEYFLNPKEIIDKLYPPNKYELKSYRVNAALEIDQSKQNDKGIITIRQLVGMPMSYPASLEGFAYTWNLNTNKDSLAIKDIVAVINITPVPTHEYSMIGCEPPILSVFRTGDGYTNYKDDIEIYKHKIRVCQTVPRFGQEYGLYCPPGHTMRPRNCGRQGYDASLKFIEAWPEFRTSSKNPMVPNMLLMRSTFIRSSTSYSRSCSCVDGDGIEVSRVVIQSYWHQWLSHTQIGPLRNMTLILPTVNTIDSLIEGRNIPEIQEISYSHFPKQNPKILFPGTTSRIECAPSLYTRDANVVNLEGKSKPFLVPSNNTLREESIDTNIHNRWDCTGTYRRRACLLPLNMDEYVYQEVSTHGEKKLVPVKYSKVLGTNTAGFRTITNTRADNVHDCGFLMLFNPVSSIIVSKVNENHVYLKYACGRVTKPRKRHDSDLKTDTYDGSKYLEKEMISMENQSQGMPPYDPSYSGDATPMTPCDTKATYSETKETRSLSVWGVIDIAIPVTDPYLRGCGMTDPSEELFREDTVPIHNDAGDRVGCEVDIAEGDASFYCPLPYFTEPTNCIPTTPTGSIRVKQPGESGNEHFYVFSKTTAGEAQEDLQRTKRESFQCHCITDTGRKMMTIRIFA
ncbi:hypothetical protein BgAZ_302140 [Babesia gibsoni]|uniref:6-Cys domain-containing protein n=1 Tax=Babesia gibsoni TaxID=33632 RepID=A0AAD8PDV4_BABGI|nr:hypothetical protein BgAZ_302140 [Babesia gibsoni]